MKTVNGALLGAAACLVSMDGAQAADLPVKAPKDHMSVDFSALKAHLSVVRRRTQAYRHLHRLTHTRRPTCAPQTL